MDIVKATPEDCRAIAELALMAGEGIPSYFWQQSKREGQTTIEYGAEKAGSESQNFSFRNAHLAMMDDRVAGMLLGYRLPDAEQDEDLSSYPAFIRPLIELERCVPGSYYINMLATYPRYRNQGIGSALMARVDGLAREAGCRLASIEVFEQNTGAVRLYERLGYRPVERRAAVPHESYPYTGQVVLLTREIDNE
ncbi:hypothetical protein RE428_13670 [Marinobacter nanhaiticus D15-8W]|uniref:GNAT family N-acetyltransferase n=1 Tax=Marinobacter nanhaiticus D15-8W TaxID=626887 RepID=N6VS31_9GAMM|nr:GNAT family N-acetyltransferase [Marinobacter nanhaiticus]ENO12995.1 GNAT family N-acetyltransferase [Marinobacter nanhaiticus D15-8W]BES70349.1 hypothetical protein RE428_13670 [Marinobacter nanhaiticus D15-8W]